MLKGLIVEDDHELSDSIKEILTPFLELDQIYDGDEGEYQAEQSIYDVLILDLMLPGKNGYDILKKMREDKNATPVLILTAKDGLDDKLKGFNLGADDYLTKPFHREELIVRVKALLKRSGGFYQENQLEVGPLILNLQNRSVEVDETHINLNGKEFDLLLYLVQNKNTIITKEQIFDRLWGFDSETSMTVVEVYMSHLRKKLKPYISEDFIKTLRNVGYMVVEDN